MTLLFFWFMWSQCCWSECR